MRAAFAEFAAEWAERGMAREPMIVETLLLSDRVRFEVTASGADPGPGFWSRLCEPAESRISFSTFRNRRGGTGVFIEVPRQPSAAGRPSRVR